MAFGKAKNDPDPGGWSYRPPRDYGDFSTPAQQVPTPPAQTAPASKAPPDKKLVTPESIAQLAEGVLPNIEASREFSEWRTKSLDELVTAVLAQAKIDESKFTKEIQKLDQEIAATLKKLNTKETSKVPEPEGESCSLLPGVCTDPTCESLFDVNDLAIRGDKAVTAKRLYVPLIFPDFLLSKGPTWGLGQKVEFVQEWRHKGFTLGSLISSFSLLPGEEVTIEVSSWQRTKTEIQQEQDEATKKSLEQELKRTDEQTISNEAANENGWSVSATAAVSFGPVSASASASANGNSSERVNQAQRHVQEATSRAASEVSSRRAVKMSHTTESQTEQKSVRRLRNPNQCHTVTFNFFQVLKLIDCQLRFINDAPVLYYPGLFPAKYSDGSPVRIPYQVIESFTAPALFLTQFFDVDRDLSQEIHGLALRVRVNVGQSGALGLRSIVEALIVATRYLMRLDPAQHIQALSRFVADYAAGAVRVREANLTTYGKDKGESIQINTPGVYVDSLLGRCSACEQEITSERYVNIQRQDADRRQIEAAANVLATEAKRREKRLEKDLLEPFDATTSES